jgi:uncharacterized protein YjbI with pentapeptide repeats
MFNTIKTIDASELLILCSKDEKDFSGLDLYDYDLSEVDLTGPILRKAYLSWANLSHSVLHKVDLTGSTITGTMLW